MSEYPFPYDLRRSFQKRTAKWAFGETALLETMHARFWITRPPRKTIDPRIGVPVIVMVEA